MSLIDVESLLNEISAELPCGDDLEYDMEFGELERAAQGKPEQQIGDTIIAAQEADWAAVRGKASKLFGRTKDLRVAICLTRALVYTEGFSGLRDGLVLIQGLLEQYWETVHPQLDPEDNDPTLRINTLVQLCDPNTVLHSAREATLVNSPKLGRFSFRDIQITLGKLSLPAGSSEKPEDVAMINAAFKDADLDKLQSTANIIRQSIECFTVIETLLMEKVGAQQMIDFSALPKLLKEAQHIMSEHLSQRGVDETKMPSASDKEEVSGTQSTNGKINSREDVIRVLDMASDYFQRHEPSSPVPLLLQRAKRLVAKDFLEILRDLTPAGVTQGEEISGIYNDKS